MADNVDRLGPRTSPPSARSVVPQTPPAPGASATIRSALPGVPSPDGMDPPVGPDRATLLGVAGPAPTPVAELRPLLPIDPHQPCRPDEIMVAHYNVENLYDAERDPTINDVPYTATGPTPYDDAMVSQHLQGLSRVIRRLNGGSGPDVLALSEVENRGVLERLRREGLADLGYSVAHVDDADPRGIECAVLTRFPVLGEPVLHRIEGGAPNKSYRGILEVNLDVHGHSLLVLVNHWPADSRGGGDEQASSAKRAVVAAALKRIVDEKLSEDPKREIVVLGDFNEGLEGPSFGEPGLAATSSPEQAVAEGRLLDTTAALAQTKRDMGPAGDGMEMGTHYYAPDREWSTLDHLLVSPTLLDNQGLAWVPSSTAVLADPDMRDPATKGPRRFFLPFLRGEPARVDPQGASDHFPVTMRLRVNGADRRPEA